MVVFDDPSLSPSDRLLCHYTQQHGLIQPDQLALALKFKRKHCGPLDMILLQLGFLTTQDLARFWTFKYAI